MGKICGMDVSYAQGSINWEQVKASKKIEFAILRAGYGRETSQVDTQFERNYAACKRLGIPGTATPLLPPKQNRKRKFACKRFGESSLNIRLRSTSKKLVACHKQMRCALPFVMHWKNRAIMRQFIRLSRLWKITSVQQLRAAMTFFSRTLACNRLLTLEHMGCGSIAGRDAFREFPVMWIWIMPTRITRL